MHNTPKYVQVYNGMLNLIKESKWPKDSKIPNEAELSKMFNVSRMTLRTALALLKEDGILQSIHGQGHFVTSLTGHSTDIGIEELSHPLTKSLSITPDDHEYYYHLNKPSVYTDELFQDLGSPYYTCNIWYKQKKENVANELTILLPRFIAKQHLDLENGNEMIDFLEHKLYSLASSSKIYISASDRDTTTFKRKFVSDEQLVLMIENLYDNVGEFVAQNKFYIPRDLFKVSINRYKPNI